MSFFHYSVNSKKSVEVFLVPTRRVEKQAVAGMAGIAGVTMIQLVRIPIF